MTTPLSFTGRAGGMDYSAAAQVAAALCREWLRLHPRATVAHLSTARAADLSLGEAIFILSIVAVESD
jgi:hypothetical protein